MVEYLFYHVVYTKCANRFMNRRPCTVDDAKMDSHLRRTRNGSPTKAFGDDERRREGRKGAGMTEREENGSPFLSSSRMRGPIRRGKDGSPTETFGDDREGTGMTEREGMTGAINAQR